MKLTAIALLAAALSMQASADVQLLPAGEFVGRDGRPGKDLTWKLSDAQGAKLAATLTARHAHVQFQFDYEHQAMHADSNGQPAPASGWCSKFEWRSGEGLFALSVQWTERALGMIQANEYKYISPVLLYDKSTGEVKDLLNAALVGRPGLTMSPVALACMAAMNASDDTPFTNPKETPPMTVALAILMALGLQADNTEAQALAAIDGLKTKSTSVLALNSALGIDQAADEATAVTAIAALKAKSVTGGDTTLAMIQGLQGELVTLKAAANAQAVEGLVQAALTAGKLVPAQVVWAKQLGNVDVAQLSAFLKDAPTVAAGLASTQSKGEPERDAAGKLVLSEEQKALCSYMGLSEDQFRAGAGIATVAA
jgi:phage I-like protein